MATKKAFQTHFVHALFLILVVWAQTGTAKEHEESHNKTERYKLLSFDFERVELPYVICLWILIVALAKIGKHVMYCYTISTIVTPLSSLILRRTLNPGIEKVQYRTNS